jgi:hypothetical protein
MVWLGVQALRESDMRMVVLAAFVILLLSYCGLRIPSKRHAIERAEELNLRFLKDAGLPYTPGGGPQAVDVPRVALIGSILVSFSLLLAFTGTLSLLLADKHPSVLHFISGGLPGALGATFGTFIYARRRSELIGQSAGQAS